MDYVVRAPHRHPIADRLADAAEARMDGNGAGRQPLLFTIGRAGPGALSTMATTDPGE